VGDNWNDPANVYLDEVALPTPYYEIYIDRHYEGKHPPITQAQLIAQLSGKATAGGTFYLTQDTHDWWQVFWHAKGSGRNETGTFTSGSTTGGTDNTKIKDTEEGCYEDFARFTTGGSYVGFILEINISGT